VEAFDMLIKFKMVDVAMVTKVQKWLDLFQTSRNFTVMFLVTCRFANRDILKVSKWLQLVGVR
jgi:hypothetical protein